jgi:hypothetical protein
MVDAQDPMPGYMGGWRWSNLGWRDQVGQNPTEILREALRRAVDIRDQTDKSKLSARPVILVDVLNELSNALGIDTDNIWERPERRPPPH